MAAFLVIAGDGSILAVGRCAADDLVLQPAPLGGRVEPIADALAEDIRHAMGAWRWPVGQAGPSADA